MTKEEINEIAWKKYPKVVERSCGFSYDMNEETRKAYAEGFEDALNYNSYCTNMVDIEIDFNEELCTLAKDFPELRKVNKMKMLHLCKHFFDLGMNYNLT